MATSVFERIVHNTDARICFLETCGVAYVFTAGAFGSKLELLAGVSDVPRLAIPMAAVMLVFLLRNAYRRSKECDYAIALTDIVLAITAAILSQVFLSFLKPDWAMPRWAPTQGGFVGTMFVTVVRTLFPQGPDDRTGSRFLTNSPAQDEIQWMASEFMKPGSAEKYCHLHRGPDRIVGASGWVFSHTGTLTNSDRMLRDHSLCLGHHSRDDHDWGNPWALSLMAHRHFIGRNWNDSIAFSNGYFTGMSDYFSRQLFCSWSGRTSTSLS